MLQIFNSISKQKENFTPVKPDEVSIYYCGVTVYDDSHVGHARSWIVFDMVVRFLKSIGYKVTLVRNITDIDDKIIRRAAENQESCDSLVERIIASFHADEKALGLLTPDHEPRATEYIPQIIELIERLIEVGVAYQADNGDICFEIKKFPDYGKLSHHDVEQLRAGARVDISEGKRDPLDFVLWKRAKPGEPKWSSPWGNGRPGWHIECSAMSSSLLGQPFDIHGGGMDLKFPHHENEIAQSEAAWNKGFANLWMHVGLVKVGREKMSKSLGNVFAIKDVLAKVHPEVLRYLMLASHYRSPVTFNEDNIAQAKQALTGLYMSLRQLPQVQAEPEPSHYHATFNAVMYDDFNTPEALSVLFDMSHEINRLRLQEKTAEAALLAQELKQLAAILGILQSDVEVFLQGGDDHAESAKIEALIAKRNHARQTKDWSTADAVRDELQALGVVIEDGPTGTTWRRH